MEVLKGLWDASPAPAVERLARIEGQSNFLSLLAGIEAGPDTTEDMGALSFSRSRGGMPEVLEAHVAQSELFKLPLMSLLFDAIRAELKPDEKEWPWIRGAVADAFLLFRFGALARHKPNSSGARPLKCKPVELRARHFRVDKAAYGAVRKLAGGVLAEWLSRAERGWYQARIRNSPANRHSDSEYSRFSSGQARAAGQAIARPFPLSDFDLTLKPSETRGFGLNDRLGWDDRNEFPRRSVADG